MGRDPRLTHLVEQLGANLEETAPIWGQYYRALVREGVSEAVAGRMLAELQLRLILGEGSFGGPGA